MVYDRPHSVWPDRIAEGEIAPEVRYFECGEVYAYTDTEN